MSLAPPIQNTPKPASNHMKIQLTPLLFLFSILIAAAYAQPPRKTAEDQIRQDIERNAAMAIMYGGKGTGIQSLKITKEYSEKHGETVVYVFDYEAEFRTVPTLRGEKETVDKITGRIGFSQQGDNWARVF